MADKHNHFNEVGAIQLHDASLYLFSLRNTSYIDPYGVASNTVPGFVLWRENLERLLGFFGVPVQNPDQLPDLVLERTYACLGDNDSTANMQFKGIATLLVRIDAPQLITIKAKLEFEGSETEDQFSFWQQISYSGSFTIWWNTEEA